jgi:hypothetical protein
MEKEQVQQQKNRRSFDSAQDDTFWVSGEQRTTATAKTTAGPSTPLRFAQDDTFLGKWWPKNNCNGKNNRRSFDSAALRSG